MFTVSIREYFSVLNVFIVCVRNTARSKSIPLLCTHVDLYKFSTVHPLSASRSTFLNSRRDGAWHHDKIEKHLDKYIFFFFVWIFFPKIFLAQEAGYSILLIQVLIGDPSISRACWYLAFKYANATLNRNFVHAIEAGILVWVWAHVDNGLWKCSITYTKLMLIYMQGKPVVDTTQDEDWTRSSCFHHGRWGWNR